MPVRYLARTPNWGVRPGGELSHPAELAPIIGSPESHPEVDDAPGHFELTAPMMHSKHSGLRRRRHTPRVLGWLRTRGVVIIPAVFMSVAILHHLIAPLQAPPGNHTHSSSREHHQHSEAPSALPRGPGGIGVLIGDDSTRPDGEAVQPPPALSPPPAPPATLVSTALVMCPTWAPALGFGGATAALSLSCLGSAYGTGKAGIGISTIGVHAPDIVMKNMIPVVMAGVLGIYGLIIAVIIADAVRPSSDGGRGYSDYTAYTGFAHLASGLCCGLSGLSAGIAIGIVGDGAVRAVAQQRKVYVGMVLILIFAEALGLYGLIVGLILASRASDDCGVAMALTSSS